MINTLATIISRIFDPFLMVGVALVILFFHMPIMFPALLLMVGLPFVLFILAWKTRFITNWDVSNRRERPKILWILLGIELLAMFILHAFSVLPIIIILLGFTLISHVWKISGHSVAGALASGVLVMRFGWAWWPILLIVPLVGWARVQTRNHTVWQVVAGAIYCWGVLFIFRLS